MTGLLLTAAAWAAFLAVLFFGLLAYRHGAHWLNRRNQAARKQATLRSIRDSGGHAELIPRKDIQP